MTVNMQLPQATRLITFVFFIGCFSISHAQTYRGQQNEILAYNILSSGIISGVSSCFNKGEGENTWKVFLKNFGRGSLGGLVKFSSKQNTYYLRDQNNTFMAPLNRAYFFLGHSISMNASLNEQRILENYYCNFYGMDVKYSPYETRGNRFQTRLSIGTLASVIGFAIGGHQLDIYRSLEYGQFYFDLEENTKYDGQLLDGLASYNAFAIRKYNGNNVASGVIPHEIIHTYQAYDFFPLSSIYKKKEKQFLNQSKLYQWASNYVNFDYEPLFQASLYYLQPTPRYYKNFFEYEAEHFSRRRLVDR